MLEFLVCEIDGEPKQVRVKAASWKPTGGGEKTVIKEEEEEEEEEEEDMHQQPDDLPESDVEDMDNEDDDDENRSQRSQSGGDPESSSAKAPEGEAAEQDPAAEGQNLEEDAAPSEVSVCPWKDGLPDRMMLLKSEVLEYQKMLEGGFWIGFDALLSLSGSYVTHVPPTIRMIKAVRNTAWPRQREGAYAQAPDRLLRIRLTPDAALKAPPPAEDSDKKPLTEPWHRVVFVYEPLARHPAFASAEASAEAAAEGAETPPPTPPPPPPPPGPPPGCLLQCVSSWQSSAATPAVPEYIQLAPGGGGGARRCIELPPGEHWFLVLDDATQAGSTLSVYADGSLLDIEENASWIDFVDPAAALEEKEMPMMSLPALEYPAQVGFGLLAKAELSLDVRVYVCVYVWVYVCMYVCMYVCLYVCMYVCMCIYIYIYIPIYIYI